MYFEINDQIKNVLCCKHCEQRLDVPKMLPCGETICLLCEASIQVRNKLFDCFVCKTEHEMPKNGFLLNKSVVEMLSAKPCILSRGQAFDSLHVSLDEIKNKVKEIKFGFENSCDYIKEKCNYLRNNAQLESEQLIEKVNEITKQVINEINEYENEMIKFNETNVDSFYEFSQIAKDLELFHKENMKYLKQPKVDEEMLIIKNANAMELIKKADMKIQLLKHSIFNGNIITFEKSNQIIDKSILGLSKTIIIDSFILSDKQLVYRLFSYCELPMIPNWQLIYRASQDGFEATSFHSKCDNKPNTLIIIKTESGNIFGGYTEQNWTPSDSFTEQSWLSTDSYKTDPKTFIFSIKNAYQYPIKINCSNNFSICCSNSYGPTFGLGHDLHIADKSNTNMNSYSNICNSYIHNRLVYGSDEAKSFLAGSVNFTVNEIEVYTN